VTQWLQQVQAKENFEIPQNTLQAVMEELHRQRVTDLNEITHKKVREVLKSLKMRKAYEHVAQITSKLTGKKPMRIPAEAEEMCRLMFIAVQPAFEKHCPKDRKNFLSCAPGLLLGAPCLLPVFLMPSPFPLRLCARVRRTLFFDAEQLCLLSVQILPAFGLRRLFGRFHTAQGTR